MNINICLYNGRGACQLQMQAKACLPFTASLQQPAIWLGKSLLQPPSSVALMFHSVFQGQPIDHNAIRFNIDLLASIARKFLINTLSVNQCHVYITKPSDPLSCRSWVLLNSRRHLIWKTRIIRLPSLSMLYFRLTAPLPLPS